MTISGAAYIIAIVRPDKETTQYYRLESLSSTGFRWECRAFGSPVTRPVLPNLYSTPYSLDNAR